ncbi:lactonase family protein [Neobacillus sp. CF12]|uniref:lactonase family protein n=1 Tax=Neobacillus sp. CF12 TaxID=3055864 RepID=UPI0025A2D99A|nr:lactonase family protein [Neobacillus sp. CF12]MDM5330524.1 lactonase family protein [Neobacillus sp. CF12]
MTNKTNFTGYIGTYTKGTSKGIYTFTLDTARDRILDVKLAAAIENPTYLTLTEDNRYLYSVAKDGKSGGLSSYSISDNGELIPINSQFSEGASPCHVSIDSKQRYVFSGNYHKGTVESYLTNQEDGAIQSASSIIQHEGSGPDPRQEKPHVHYTGLTPDENYLAVVDLGTDTLTTYAVNPDGKLTKVQLLPLKAGSGPRHLAFHPNGKSAYLMTEFSSEVIVFTYDSQTGHFTEKQYISTLPEEFKENNQGSAIKISEDGRFVYAGNRGHNSIAVFSVNEETGGLTFVEHTSTEGDWPRDFEIDPTGRYIVASNQESSNLVLFARDEDTGKLTLLQSDIKVPYPVCVKFLG